jgi:hypothetical protein
MQKEQLVSYARIEDMILKNKKRKQLIILIPILFALSAPIVFFILYYLR